MLTYGEAFETFCLVAGLVTTLLIFAPNPAE